MSNPKFKLSGSIWESALRIGSSLLSGGVFYTGWLGAFLLLDPEGTFFETIVWMTAPFITGLGFGFGVHLVNKLLKKDLEPFHQIAFWPILGCILGAVAVYWFGPMLIVFSMLAAGTVSVSIREFILQR